MSGTRFVWAVAVLLVVGGSSAVSAQEGRSIKPEDARAGTPSAAPKKGLALAAERGLKAFLEKTQAGRVKNMASLTKALAEKREAFQAALRQQPEYRAYSVKRAALLADIKKIAREAPAAGEKGGQTKPVGGNTLRGRAGAEFLELDRLGAKAGPNRQPAGIPDMKSDKRWEDPIVKRQLQPKIAELRRLNEELGPMRKKAAIAAGIKPAEMSGLFLRYFGGKPLIAPTLENCFVHVSTAAPRPEAARTMGAPIPTPADVPRGSMTIQLQPPYSDVGSYEIGYRYARQGELVFPDDGLMSFINNDIGGCYYGDEFIITSEGPPHPVATPVSSQMGTYVGGTVTIPPGYTRLVVTGRERLRSMVAEIGLVDGPVQVTFEHFAILSAEHGNVTQTETKNAMIRNVYVASGSFRWREYRPPHLAAEDVSFEFRIPDNGGQYLVQFGHGVRITQEPGTACVDVYRAAWLDEIKIEASP